MSKNRPLRLFISAAIMIGALLFGLYPEPSQTKVAALASSQIVR
jgi:hypothetical protein